MTAPTLAELDSLLDGQGEDRWNAFYADRARPCPFFGDRPDENLVEWLERGRVASGRALDLGCGNGRNAIFLARRGFEVTGVDLSPQAIAWATQRAREAQVAGVGWACVSVFDLSLDPGSFDLVYDSGCFHHIAPHRRAGYVRLVAEALRPGGKFGLVCFRPEGGSGLSDEEVYCRGSLGGGLGYTEAALRECWSAGGLVVQDVRQMREQPPAATVFGQSFLWTLFAEKPADR